MSSPKPFFKSVENTAVGSNYFAAVGHSRQKENDSHNEKQSTHQDQAEGSERMSVLHSRLQQEADNIRKWKTHTEMELKQKERKLQEATHTIGALRKSTLEMQLQNENLSLKLQEELANREEIISRINGTRDMCNLLKEYASGVEDRLQKCETEKTEVKYMEKEHKDELEKLATEFRELTVVTSQARDEMKTELDKVKEEKAALREEYDETKLASKEQVGSLTKECGEKTAHIEKLSEELSANLSCLEELHKQHDLLQQALTIACEEATESRTKLSITKDDLETLKSSHKATEAELRDVGQRLAQANASTVKLTADLDETERLYVDKLKTLQDELTSCQHDIEAKAQRIESLQSDVTKGQQVIEDLKCTKDMLILERTETQKSIKEKETAYVTLQQKFQDVEDQLEFSKTDNTQLNTDLTKLQEKAVCYEEEISTLTTQISTAEADIQQLTDKLASTQNYCGELKQTLSDAMDRETKTLHSMDQLKSELSTQSKERSELYEKMTELESQHSRMEVELATKEDKIKTLMEQLQSAVKSSDDLQVKLNEAQKQLETMQDDINGRDEEAKQSISESESKLSHEISSKEKLQKELTKANKKVSDLDSKMKSVKEDLQSKNKQLKELEKQLKSTTSQLAAQTTGHEELEEKACNLERQLSAVTNERDRLLQSTQHYTEKASHNQTELDNALKESSDLRQAAQKLEEEKAALQSECDFKLKEMNLAVGSYKEWYDKLVASKDKQLEESSSKLTSADEKITAMEKEIEQLKQREETRMCEEDGAGKEVLKEVEKEKKSLEKTVAKKDKQLETMQKKLEKAEAKNEQCKQQTKELKEQSKKIDALKEDLDVKIATVHSLEEELSKLRESNKENTTEKPTTNPQVDSMEEDTDMTPEPEIPPLAASSPKLTSQQKARQFSTPKFNQAVVDAREEEMSTDYSTAVTPKYTTPHATQPVRPVGILKTPGTGETQSVKRRKVLFTEEDSESVCSQCSSTSDFLEVEMTEEGGAMLKASGKSGVGTPLLMKPAALSMSPYTKTPTRGIPTPTRPSALPVKLPVPPYKKTPGRDQKQHKEPQPKVSKPPESPAAQKTGQIRKAPAKTPGKFFKTSPMERQKQKLKGLGQKQDTSWFDMDSTFGFGPED